MKCKFILFLLFFIKSVTGQVVVSGFVTDKSTGEPLPGATVYDQNSTLGTVTNLHGYFSLKTNSQENTVVFSFVGYSPKTLTIKAFNDTSLRVQLVPDLEIKEVIVTSAKSKEQTLIHGLTSISPAQMDALPTLGGEKDLLKAITVLPGVMEGREGFSSLFVRGGSSDQNLFILDDAPVYNSGHLFNFFSVFNAQAIKQVNLYKNNYPAKYGGKLSSVVDIMFKDGNKEEFKGIFDLGVINSKLLLEGPIGSKKKTSILFAARSTYLDIFNLTKKKQFKYNAIDSYWGYTFYDINGKLSYEINQNNKIFLSFFRGQDYYRTFDQNNHTYKKFSYNLLNSTLSLHSYHVLSPSLFFKTSASYVTNQGKTSIYNEEYTFPMVITEEKIHSYKNLYKRITSYNSNKLEDLTLNLDLTWQYSINNTLNLGMVYIGHEFHPSLFSENNEYFDSTDYVVNTKLNEPVYRTTETGYYLENTMRLQKFQFITGLRYSTYKHENTFYANLEPRISASYKTSGIGSFQASYTRMQQYNHALNRNDQVLDMMVWVPSTKNIPPQLAHQYSLGYALSLPSRGIGISVNSYFKKMNQLTFYRTNYGASYYNWQKNTLTGGKGKSYGIEMDMDKHGENFSTKISYCLSWNFRQFQELNKGRWFPYLYDRRHVFTITGNYKLNDKWSFKALWTISSGHRINFPDGKTEQPQSSFLPINSYYVYSSMNNRQLPTYHRLDLGAERKRVMGNKKELIVAFNVYNAYFRKNPNYLYLDQKNNQVKSVSLIPILPTMNITFKF
jgi:hypothetical protein